MVLIMTSSGTPRTSSEMISSLDSSSNSGIISTSTTSISLSSQQFLADTDVKRVAQAVARIIAPSVQDPTSTAAGTGSSSTNKGYCRQYPSILCWA